MKKIASTKKKVAPSKKGGLINFKKYRLDENIFDIGKKVAKAVYKKLPGRFITEDNKIPRLTFKPKPSKNSSISEVVYIDPKKSVGDNPKLLLKSRQRRPYDNPAVIHIDPKKSVGDKLELLLKSRERQRYRYQNEDNRLVSRSEGSLGEIFRSLSDKEMANRQSDDRIVKEIAKRQLDDKRQSDDRADRQFRQFYEDLKASRKQVKKSKGGRKSTKKY